MNPRRKGILASGLSSIVHIVVNLLYIPVLLKLLGQAEYGLYQMVGSFFSYLTIFESSVSAGVLKFYCKAVHDGEDSANEVLGTARKIFFFFSVGFIFAGIIGSTVFWRVYCMSLSSEELNESIIMLALLVFNFVITLNNAVYLAIINGNERFFFLKMLSVFSQLLQPLICIFVLFQAPYAVAVIIVQLGMNVILILARRLYVHKERLIGKGKKEFDCEIAKSIIFFAGSILLAQIADQIFWKTDQLILGKLYNTAVVAVYAVGSQIYLNYMYIGILVSSVFFPRISKIYMEDKCMEKLSRLFIKVGRITFFIVLLVLSGFLIYGQAFVAIWAGHGYEEAYLVAGIVMIPFSVDICQNIGLTILQVMDQYAFRAKMYFVAAVLNVFLTVIMARRMGIIGAALSTAISMTVTSGFCLNFFYSRKIGLQIMEFWKNILVILGKVLPVIVIGVVLNIVLPSHMGALGLVIKIITYTLIYGLTAFCWIMNEEEKSIVKDILDKVLRVQRKMP